MVISYTETKQRAVLIHLPGDITVQQAIEGLEKRQLTSLKRACMCIVGLGLIAMGMKFQWINLEIEADPLVSLFLVLAFIFLVIQGFRDALNATATAGILEIMRQDSSAADSSE